MELYKAQIRKHSPDSGYKEVASFIFEPTEESIDNLHWMNRSIPALRKLKDGASTTVDYINFKEEENLFGNHPPQAKVTRLVGNKVF